MKIVKPLSRTSITACCLLGYHHSLSLSLLEVLMLLISQGWQVYQRFLDAGSYDIQGTSEQTIDKPQHLKFSNLAAREDSSMAIKASQVDKVYIRLSLLV